MSAPTDLVVFMKAHEERLSGLGMTYMFESDEVVELHHGSLRMMFDARHPTYRAAALSNAVALLASLVVEGP